jgi:hypothetical protein
MEDFFEIQLGDDESVQITFKSPLFRNLVAGLPTLWALLADLKTESESKARRRFYGSPHAEGSSEDFWEELVVPELEGELRSDRDLVFGAIEAWAGPEGRVDGVEVSELKIHRGLLGAWIGVFGQVRLMISEETGVSEAELAKAGLTDRRRALALGLWVYGAILESLMPYWE